MSEPKRLTLEEYREIANREVKKRNYSHEESDIQISCVEWFKIQYPKMLIFAVPNGGKRAMKDIHTKNGVKSVPLEAMKMKDEGVLAGVSDLILAYASKGYHGLFIEMKTETGTQSDSQKAFQVKAEYFGYKYVVCRSFLQFMKEVNDYIK